jgi:hypothetical protein
MVKYKATAVFGRYAIERVEVERETDQSVFIKVGSRGQDVRRHAKVASDWRYMDTFEDAIAYLLQMARRDLDHKKAEVVRAEGALASLLGTREMDT